MGVSIKTISCCCTRPPCRRCRRSRFFGRFDVAEDQDQKIAACGSSYIKPGMELHIHELSVRQQFQGQGAGRKLLLTALEHADKRKLHSLTLTTFRDLPWNEPFYRRFGFETLSPAEIGPRLTSVLNNEINHGLPGERRCAMRLKLR
ncbi:GNAT family N-acetyltransferase [Pseudomonas sp. EL_65y_Pfl2_R96]|uniref:GNAT family N-acetyltransferase n=1 Tax=Pseudomonas sp. EL_65y_Pfl2_R96 TaxID=3088699 RepID=UPI0030D76D93